jgi:hypothetical protein
MDLAERAANWTNIRRQTPEESGTDGISKGSDSRTVCSGMGAKPTRSVMRNGIAGSELPDRNSRRAR